MRLLLPVMLVAERSELRVAVLQPGARLHYAVPTLLARAGMLQRLYTDFCASVGPFRHAERVWPTSLQPAAIRRLLGRKLPPDIPHETVRQVRGAVLCNQIIEKLGLGHDPRTVSQLLIARARAERLGGANVLYTVVVNDDLDLCREAKARGCRIIHEAMMNPDIGLWLGEEHERFPTVPRRVPLPERVNAGRGRDRRKYEIADLVIVPSDFVYQSVLKLGADPRRVAIVPYGIEESWLQTTPRPIPGRVLFVGAVGLLKGSHYLAEASRLLGKRNVPCTVRVVGKAAADIIRNPLFAGPDYVGSVPRAQVRSEFLAADVFVFPSLCEGFALVHLEAMASGVPVVTTPNCGSIVRDGIDGFIVPVRSAAALADATERIVSDRALRARMSENARQRAREFTWRRYGERLIGALSRFQPVKEIA